MMLFNIVLVPADPSALNGVDPTLEYMCEAISACGHQVIVSHGQVYPGAINLLPDGYYTREGIDALMKQRDEQGLRLGLVTSELYLDKQIPYGLYGLYMGGDTVKTAAVLEQRLDALYYLATKVDFVWSLLERSAGEFSKLCSGPSLWFPYGHAAGLPAEFRNFPRALDVLFVGKATPHRTAIIEHLTDGGLKVLAFGMGFPRGHLPDIFLNSTLCQAKIMLNFTFTHFGLPDVDPRFSSCTRVVQALERDVCVVSEFIPHDNPYESFMIQVAPHRILDVCKELLQTGSWEQAGLDFAAHFRHQMDARIICQPAIDAVIARYMN